MADDGVEAIAPKKARYRVVVPSVIALSASAYVVEVEPPPPPAQPEIAKIEPVVHKNPIRPEPAYGPEILTGEIKKRDTLSTALARLDVSVVEAEAIAKAMKGAVDARALRPGQTFELEKDAEGRVGWLRYQKNRIDAEQLYRRSDGSWAVVAEPVQRKVETVRVDGLIEDSLYRAIERSGERVDLAAAIVDVFAWDIDFYTETRKNDRFHVVIEKRWANGEVEGYGPIAAAEYQHASGQAHRAFRFEMKDGKIGYYTEDGESVQKAFLKSPLKFTAITSGFGLRKHPILEYVGTHKGIDYAAPKGTEVWAVGDGVVTQAGWLGGYGNVVFIQHRNGLETRYAHLSGFGPGIQKGTRIEQKQVIGFVGQTGLATGPHLHFEVLEHGQHQNPLKVVVPPAPPIPNEELGDFRESIAPYLSEFDGAS